MGVIKTIGFFSTFVQKFFQHLGSEVLTKGNLNVLVN